MFATYADLVADYGQQKIDEISQYTEFDSGLNDYVTVTDRVKLQERAERALTQACAMLRMKISCCYDLEVLDQHIADGLVFEALKIYHSKMAYILLKYQSTDCKECKECMSDFNDLCNCGQICATGSEGLVCLEKNNCFEIEEKNRCIPDMCDICCSAQCNCCGSESEV